MKKLCKTEEGFTLIELLVVMVIIGILSAIAVPVFANEKKRALEASIQSDLRRLSSEQEIWYLDNGRYFSHIDLSNSLVNFLPSSAVQVEVLWAHMNGFCAVGTLVDSIPGSDSIFYITAFENPKRITHIDVGCKDSQGLGDSTALPSPSSTPTPVVTIPTPTSTPAPTSSAPVSTSAPSTSSPAPVNTPSVSITPSITPTSAPSSTPSAIAPSPSSSSTPSSSMPTSTPSPTCKPGGLLSGIIGWLTGRC